MNKVICYIIATFLILFMLAGCATVPNQYAIGNMLPGQIISLSDGKILPMQIELTPMSHPTGKMTATDPTTGEQFTGNYTFIVETKFANQSRPGLLGSETAGQTVQVSNVAPGTAVLVGDKGTVLNIKMTARAGNPPVGTGEAEDNNGKKYSLHF